MTEVVNNRAHHRYELTVDGHLAATYYAISDGVITFIHQVQARAWYSARVLVFRVSRSTATPGRSATCSTSP